MSKSFFFPLACVVILSSWLVSSTSASALLFKPNWDLDYELYYGEYVPAFQLWVEEPGKAPRIYGTYDEYYEASNRWFFLVEHNAFPQGTKFWITETTRLKWRYVAEFEIYSDAVTAAGYFQAVGFQTKIKAIYGGVDYSNLITPQLNNNPYYWYVLGD